MHRFTARILLAVTGAVTVAAPMTFTSVPPAWAATGITNGDFETSNLAGWTSTGSTSVTTSALHSRQYAARVGNPRPPMGTYR